MVPHLLMQSRGQASYRKRTAWVREADPFRYTFFAGRFPLCRFRGASFDATVEPGIHARSRSSGSPALNL